MWDAAGEHRTFGSVTVWFTRDTQLFVAARRGDLTMFEYLVEQQGLAIPPATELDAATQAMMTKMWQRRREWTNQAGALAHRWHVPLTAVRVIHEYVVGFNWSSIYELLSQSSQEIHRLAR